MIGAHRTNRHIENIDKQRDGRTNPARNLRSFNRNISQKSPKIKQKSGQPKIRLFFIIQKEKLPIF